MIRAMQSFAKKHPNLSSVTNGDAQDQSFKFDITSLSNKYILFKKNKETTCNTSESCLKTVLQINSVGPYPQNKQNLQLETKANYSDVLKFWRLLTRYPLQHKLFPRCVDEEKILLQYLHLINDQMNLHLLRSNIQFFGLLTLLKLFLLKLPVRIQFL